MRSAQNRSGLRSWSAARAPGVLALLLSLCVMAALTMALRGQAGFPLDDSWIHQSVARNFARYGSLGYLPHQRSSGSTSLLWTVVLAVKYLVLAPVSPVAYSLLINGACLTGIVLLLLQLALKDGMSAGVALLWALAPLADGNFVWLAFTGMEHLLFVLLSLLSITLWTEEEVPAVLAGVPMGLLAMTRPEGVVLPLALLVLPLGVARRGAARLWAWLPVAVLAAIPFAVNLTTAHALLPLTFKGRQWLYFGAVQLSPSVHAALLLAWFHRLLLAFAVPGNGAQSLLHRAMNFTCSAVLVLLSVAGLGSLWRRHYRRTLLLCGWGILHSMLYIVMLPTPGHGGRYQPFVLMLMLPLSIMTVYEAISRWSLNPLLPLRVAGILLSVAAVFSLHLWYATLQAGVRHIEGSHGVMAAYLNQHLPGQTIALFDIGRIGYSYRGDIVDLGGLTDESYLPYLLTGRVPTYLQRHKVQYIVLPENMDGQSRLADSLHLAHASGLQLQEVYRVCSPQQLWELSFLQTSNAFQCQALDRIHFPIQGAYAQSVAH